MEDDCLVRQNPIEQLTLLEAFIGPVHLCGLSGSLLATLGP
jgi:hypothetical protein